MSELKVGDKFIDSVGNKVEISAIGRHSVFMYNPSSEVEWLIGKSQFYLKYTPYQEPATVKRIVAHELLEIGSIDGEVRFSIEGSPACGFRDRSDQIRRIEIKPSMFGWEG